MSKLIPLYRRTGMTCISTVVDDADFETLNQYKWYIVVGKGGIYPVRYYKREDGKWITLLMHVALMGQPPKGFEWDHKDQDKLNNQRNNIRLATRAQNCANRKTYSCTGYKGVWQKSLNRWGAQITINKQHFRLGSFRTPEDAARAYDKKALAVWGEYACLNFHPES